MKITFCGAAGEVTGSQHLIECGKLRVLLDCGLFQGRRGETRARNSYFRHKPAELDFVILSHAHIDHMYHADEFSTVYMHKADIDAWGRQLRRVVNISALGFGRKMKKYDVKNFRALTDGSEIDLGDRHIKVIDAAGHTPGSCIYVDETDRLLFTGDAVGSGDGAWMWMPGCLDISPYMESLKKMIIGLRNIIVTASPS